VLSPIPETVEAAKELGRYDPDLDVLAYLQDIADQVQALVPDCMGLSLTWIEHEVTFTLVASDAEIAVRDAVQYLAGGPCVDGVAEDQGLTVDADGLLSEDHWQLFAEATRAKGVKSTLTLPLVQGQRVVGSANLYAGSNRAFDGHHQDLARILGARVADIVSNADLSFSTRSTAELAPANLTAQNAIDKAVGILIASLHLDPDTATKRLAESANRAGIRVEQLARALLSIRNDQGST
jgi:GAF domain-containing protein